MPNTQDHRNKHTEKHPGASQPEEAAQVRIRRVYRVAPGKVWRAWTEPQALSQWFGSGLPGSVKAAEIDLRVGGRYRIAFTCSKGESHEVSGEYQEVLPAEKLVFTWAWKSTPERVSRVSIDLQPLALNDADGQADGTEMLFVHDRFFDAAARNNHEGGWLAMVEQLTGFLQPAPQAA